MTQHSIHIRRAKLPDVDTLVALFDGYRQFYGQSPDLSGVRAFLQMRLERAESVIFLALLGDSAAGFTQLYPSFSSVSMKRVWILNDLFTAQGHRRQGVGRALLGAAEQFALDDGAKGLALSTAKANSTAKALYESCGWKQDVVFDHYHRYF